MKQRLIRHKWWVVGLFVVVVAVAMLFIWVETSRAPTTDPTPVGAETTIEGEAVCLPHKDTSGPQTLECAFGIKLDDGTYYGLSDADPNYANVSTLPTGKRVRLSGTLKQEPSDIYQSTGTFTITKSEPL